MRVGFGRGEGRVGRERRSASPWESGIGYRLQCRGVYGIVNLATFRIWRLDIVMIVGLDGGDDNEAMVGVGREVGANDVGGGGDGSAGWGEGTLSFRLKTGRSPKNRMHLTERLDREFRKCSK